MVVVRGERLAMYDYSKKESQRMKGKLVKSRFATYRNTWQYRKLLNMSQIQEKRKNKNKKAKQCAALKESFYKR